MAKPSTYSIVACDLEAAEWGVAVQSKFLAVGAGVPAAEPHVGAVATQALANMRYGPDGLALLRQRPLRRGGRPAPDRGRRRPGRPTARSRRRPGSRGDLHGAELPRLGRGDHRRGLRGPGQHPRLGGDGHRPRANVRDDGRQAARRTPPRRAHGSAGSGRRPPGAAVRRAPRRPQGRRLHGHDGRGCRSACRRPPHADRGASPDLRHARPPLRRDTRRGVARRGRADRTRAPRAARRARLRRRGPRARLPRLGGHGEPRRTREGESTASTPSSSPSYAGSPRRRRRRKRRAE